MESNPKKSINTLHPCASILHSVRTHTLNHVLYHEYNWIYKIRIWDELRPLKTKKIDYGSSDTPFIITRKKIPRNELYELCMWHKQRLIEQK